VLNVAAIDQISVDELNEDATRLSAGDRKRTLVLGLANAIVAVVTAERAAELTRVGLRVALEQAEIVVRKQGLGGATAIDVVRAQQNAENARATLVSGDEVLRQAREALGVALGFPEETGVSHELSVGEIAADAQAVCPPVRSIEERPDVASARANLDVAKRNLRNVWYGFLPTLTAASTLSATTVVAQGSPNPTWNVQGLLTVPLWDGGARYGTVRVARAEEDTAAQELEALRRDGLIQVEQAQRGLVVAQLAYHVAVRQRDLSARNDVLNQMAYLAGQGTSLELVTASEAHREAELNLALKEFGVVRSRLLAALALAACP
jgi:outer membrane protein, multidrug efflux system